MKKSKLLIALLALAIFAVAATPAMALYEEIRLPVKSFIGTVEYVKNSDLSRFELVTSDLRPIVPMVWPPAPPKPERYVLLVPENIRVALEKYVTTNYGGVVLPKVLVRGALVYVPSLQGVKKAIVVKSVSLYKNGKPVPLK